MSLLILLQEVVRRHVPRLRWKIRCFFALHCPRVLSLKPSDVCYRAAHLVKGGDAFGGCYALVVALGSTASWNLHGEAAHVHAAAAAAFNEYKPEGKEDGGFWWYPIGNNPLRINALLNAAEDLRVKGQ